MIELHQRPVIVVRPDEMPIPISFDEYSRADGMPPGRRYHADAPGGYHVMLVELKRDLNVGDEVQVTYLSHDHEEITLAIPVLEHGHDFMNGH